MRLLRRRSWLRGWDDETLSCGRFLEFSVWGCYLVTWQFGHIFEENLYRLVFPSAVYSDRFSGGLIDWNGSDERRVILCNLFWFLEHHDGDLIYSFSCITTNMISDAAQLGLMFSGITRRVMPETTRGVCCLTLSRWWFTLTAWLN